MHQYQLHPEALAKLRLVRPEHGRLARASDRVPRGLARTQRRATLTGESPTLFQLTLENPGPINLRRNGSDHAAARAAALRYSFGDGSVPKVRQRPERGHRSGRTHHQRLHGNS